MMSARPHRRDSTDLRASLDRDGLVWLRGASPADEVARLLSVSDPGDRPGVRLSGTTPLAQAVAGSAAARRIAEVWPGMRPVRIVSFDKSASVDWGVPWHQDRVIALRDRAEVAGYGTWSRKAGIWHCEPPATILDAMLFVRLHLDPCGVANGAMEVAPGSHALGPVSSGEAATRATEFPVQTPEAAAGDVLVLKMLTLHRSAPSGAEAPRRVLRIDFAPPGLLPGPLDWAV